MENVTGTLWFLDLNKSDHQTVSVRLSVDFHMPYFFSFSFLIWPHGFICRKMALKYANYTFPSVKLPPTIVMNISLVWGVHTYLKCWLSKYLMVLIFLQASEHPATLWLLPRCLSCVPHPGVCTQGRAVQRAPALWSFSWEHKRHGKSAELRPFRHSCCSIIQRSFPSFTEWK